jgi:alanine racemase
MNDVPTARAWVEVDLAALRANYQAIRDRIGAAAAIIPMVKADGYGLGALRVVRALDPLAPWGYGVATAQEGAALRQAGVERPIIVCTPLTPQAAAAAAAHGLIATISSLDGLAAWRAAAERAGRALEYHVEVDTGMGRSGLPWRDAAAWGAALAADVGQAAGVADSPSPEGSGGVRWTGVYTHFHSADEVDAAPSAAQWERFAAALAGLPVPRKRLLVHAANSAAALRWPAYAADAVRPGIFLYGAHPAPGLATDELQAPRPVVAVRARVVLVRDVPAGATVGYGATHTALRPERWATLAIGYGDGLARSFAGGGAVLVAGRRAPVVGRISMDMTVVDVSAVPAVRTGAVATVLGRDGAGAVTVEELAARTGTIGYEVLTRLAPRLPRVEVASTGTVEAADGPVD